jgi:hypothetical protein
MSKYKSIIFQIVLFIILPIYFGRDLILSDNLIGRYIDFTVPPVDILSSNAFFSSFYLWNETFNNGVRAGFASTLIPQQLLLYAPLLFTNSVWFLARWQIIMPLALCGIGYVFLYRTIVFENNDEVEKDSVLQNLIFPTLFGIAFTYTNFSLSTVSFGSVNSLISVAVLPYAIAFYWRYFDRKRYDDLFFCVITVCIIGSMLQYLVLIYIFLSALSISKGSWKPFLNVALLHIAISLYWMLPLLAMFTDIVSNELATEYEFSVMGQKLYDIFFQRDFALRRTIYLKLLNNPLEKVIYIIGTIGSLVVPLFLLSKFKPANIKTIFIMYVILFIFIFLLKGSNEPFSIVNHIFHKFVPGSPLFRSLQHFMFICAASMSVISAIFFRDFITLNKLGGKFTFLMVLVFTSLSLPWWLHSDFGFDKLRNMSQPTTVTPFMLSEGEKRFYELNNKKEDFKILTHPPAYSVTFVNLGYPYSWLSQGGDAGLQYGNKPFFSTDNGKHKNLGSLVEILEESMYKDQNFLKQHQEILKIMGVRYFVVRKSIKPAFSKHANKYQQINYNIDQSIGRQIYEDSSVQIIELMDWLPFVWSPKSIKDLGRILFSSHEYDIVPSIALDEFKEINSLGSLTSLEYDHINPTRYTIQLSGVKGRIPIFLNFNFHPAWVLSVLPVDMTDGSSKVKMNVSDIKDIFSNSNAFNHLIGPLGTNGWILDTDKICLTSMACTHNDDGTFDISLALNFWPQFLFIIGMFISGLTALVLFMIYLMQTKPLKTAIRTLRFKYEV